MATKKSPAEKKQVSAADNNAKAVKKAPTVAKKNAKQAEPDPEQSIESAINKTENFIYDNGKSLLTILIVIVLVIGLFLAYKYLYMGNRAEKAAAAMYVAERQFVIDSFQLALEGDGNNAGFLDIIGSYGCTPQGNVARQYAALCYIKMGDQDNALKYLQDFKHKKGVPNAIINAQNYGLQADIFSDKGEYDKAVALYEKAVNAADNNFTTPYYLKKMGLVYEKLGKNEQALKIYQRIASEHVGSVEERDIEKYIGALEQK